MHGLIFASLRDYTAARFGEERAAEILSDRVFETTEAYDDRLFTEQLERLVAASGDSMQGIQRGLGEFAAQKTFAGLYPDYYQQSGDTFTFCSGSRRRSTSSCAPRSAAPTRRSSTSSR